MTGFRRILGCFSLIFPLIMLFRGLFYRNYAIFGIFQWDFSGRLPFSGFSKVIVFIGLPFSVFLISFSLNRINPETSIFTQLQLTFSRRSLMIKNRVLLNLNDTASTRS